MSLAKSEQILLTDRFQLVLGSILYYQHSAVDILETLPGFYRLRKTHGLLANKLSIANTTNS